MDLNRRIILVMATHLCLVACFLSTVGAQGNNALPPTRSPVPGPGGNTNPPPVIVARPQLIPGPVATSPQQPQQPSPQPQQPSRLPQQPFQQPQQPSQQAPQQLPVATVDNSCLQCICEASTGCKPTKCHQNGPTEYYCGPYLISWAYWSDAGKPNDDINNPYAFENCLTDFACAATTIGQYMAKNGRDCDGNGVIDCKDIARIHKAGPLNCHGKWVDDTPYWNSFSKCIF